jgi:uncharacterized protein YndB with AHSA1/START domain
MTFSDNTPPSQTEFISLEFDLQHPPEKVWRALTDPELLAQWLLPVINFKLEPGTAFRFQAPPQPGWDGKVHCKLLEFEPPSMIRYQWVVGEMDTMVTFLLTPTDTGTHLSLVHSGFKPDQKQNFGGARYGWGMMGKRLVDVLAKISTGNAKEDRC